MTFIHPSSVNLRKKELKDQETLVTGERQLFAFTEKRQNVSVAGGGSQTFLLTTTRLDPMTYMLFGAHKLEVKERGLECDNWLPIVGNLDALDDIQHLKTLMEACMLRVFEGLVVSRGRQGQSLGISPREESELGDIDEHKDYSMSLDEVRELDLLTCRCVRILNRYSEERVSQSRSNSSLAIPMGSPSAQSPWSLGSSRSGFSTPSYGGSTLFGSRAGTPTGSYGGSTSFNSGASTPSKLSRKF
jgi:small subunit ribosomal protein S24e